MANRLARSASPYLRQHEDNPVDWYEWSGEAFEQARADDLPVFLSVGYSSCHWCHVMAHESFEDPEIAAVLNERFVCIKVDREERPDIDGIYMDAVQAMTGRGGWPMSVFATPDGRPFFAGTYWPKEDRHGMPGFPKVLDAVWDAWTNQRQEVEESAGKVTAHIQALQQVEAAGDVVDASVPARAADQAARAWDERHGGFGSAPKFPHAMTVDFLLAYHARTGDETALRVATHSLDRMARGGIFDQVGGGFSRYAVDDKWAVPHFEKMLSDNALLLRAYTHGWQLTGDPRFARVVRETVAWLFREMRHPGGAFYTALDADSDGEEGAFYVWSEAELRETVAAAGEDPDRWQAYFGVTPEGNFEGGRTVLAEVDEDDPATDPTDTEAADARETVRAALRLRREQRPYPGLDDKILASWNGLLIGALAEAGSALAEPEWVRAAGEAARFLESELVVDGRLRHAWKEGHGPTDQTFAEDLADLAQGLLALYGADHEPRWVSWAAELVADADRRFAEHEPTGGFTGAYHATPDDGEQLVARPKEVWDNAVPAPASALADAHLQLGALTGDPTHRERAETILQLFAARASQAPTGHGEMLRATERSLGGPQEVAIVGRLDEPGTSDLVRVFRETVRPGAVLAVGDGAEPAHIVPLLADRPRIDGRPTAYVCREFACEQPVARPEDLRRKLAAA